jgi:hypothetical protein
LITEEIKTVEKVFFNLTPGAVCRMMSVVPRGSKEQQSLAGCSGSEAMIRMRSFTTPAFGE